MKTKTFPCLLALAAVLPLAGCAQPGGPGSPKPTAAAASSATLPPAVGASATVNETDTGKTVRIGLGESVAIRLAVNESTGNRWFLNNRLQGGVLFKKGSTTYTQTPAGSVATLIYQGMRPGSQEMHFTYAPPDARQNVARAVDFRVIVQ